MVNIPSMHGGSNLWGEPKKADRQNVSEEKHYEVITDPEALKISSQGETSLFAFPLKKIKRNICFTRNKNKCQLPDCYFPY